MSGAGALLATLAASGVEPCFGNPGTSEMHFVAALDHVAGMRGVLALEGDGAAMCTPRALRRIARESPPVAVVVFANRAYRILQGELKGVGAQAGGPTPCCGWTGRRSTG
jgi:thiamine pyrophosphate-dependent acetolactate synthase large subunit-like protein